MKTMTSKIVQYASIHDALDRLFSPLIQLMTLVNLAITVAVLRYFSPEKIALAKQELLDKYNHANTDLSAIWWLFKSGSIVFMSLSLVGLMGLGLLCWIMFDLIDTEKDCHHE